MYFQKVKTLEPLLYEAGAKQAVKIPRDRLLKGVLLEFDATLTTSGGTTSGTVKANAVLQLFQNIEIIANGTLVLYGRDGRAGYYENFHQFGTIGDLTDPTSDDEADYTLHAFMYIPFKNNLGVSPADSFLATSIFTSLNLVIHWASLSAMITGGNRVHALAAGDGLTVTIVESTDPAPAWIRFRDVIEDVVTATLPSFPIDLPVGNKIHQNLFFMTTDAGVLADDIINSISLVSSDDIKHIDELPFDVLQHMNKLSSSIETFQAGMANLYLLEEGSIRKGLSTMEYNTLKLKLNVTVGAGTTKIRVYTDYMVPFGTFLRGL